MIPTDQYRELFERSADAVLILDGEKFIDCNRATVEMLGYPSREALLQTHPSELSPEFQKDGLPSFEKANEMISIALEKGNHRFEWSHKRANGEVFPVEVLLTAVPMGGRTILYTVWRDITERKRLESELRHAQKMEAIGRLTGAISHDFNNLLVAIIGNAELLEMSLDPHSELMECVNEIHRAGDRAAELVKQLLAFSRKQVIQPKVLDLNQVFTELEKMLQRLLGDDIQIKSQLTDRPLWVNVDPGQLEQVIINLATNARDAMPAGGTLSFTTATTEITADNEIANTELAAGQYAEFTVGDTGTGMSEVILANIFEPFFTTKEQGQGTGLGLATVFGIVKRLGGDITVQTKENKGTIFRVFLPRSSASTVTGQRDLPNVGSMFAGSETILLVEDEPAVANVVKSVLQSSGYTVHVADNGETALDLIADQKLKFDLLLTDVAMPRMGGPELAAHLRTSQRHLKVLYISGYTSSSWTDFGNLKEGINLIQKPFSAQKLLAKLREILDKSN